MAEMMKEWLGNKNMDLRECEGDLGWDREEDKFRGAS